MNLSKEKIEKIKDGLIQRKQMSVDYPIMILKKI